MPARKDDLSRKDMAIDERLDARLRAALRELTEVLIGSIGTGDFIVAVAHIRPKPKAKLKPKARRRAPRASKVRVD